MGIECMFETELKRIKNENIREFAANLLDSGNIPLYFWEDGASSSGKYHPRFSQGDGGLIRHTKAVCLILEDMLRLWDFSEEEQDYARVAALFHDCVKYGTEVFDKSKYKFHAENAAELIGKNWKSAFNEDCPECLINAMRRHMGRWGADKPQTEFDYAIHLADYFASRSYIDIPSITEDYKISHRAFEEQTLYDVVEEGCIITRED